MVAGRQDRRTAAQAPEGAAMGRTMKERERENARRRMRRLEDRLGRGSAEEVYEDRFWAYAAWLRERHKEGLKGFAYADLAACITAGVPPGSVMQRRTVIEAMGLRPKP